MTQPSIPVGEIERTPPPRHRAGVAPVEHRLATAGKKLDIGSLTNGMEKLGGFMDLSHVPSEAWIDADGRVHEFRITFALSAAGRGVKSVETTRFSQFGENVNVTAPPRSDVVTFAQVLDLGPRLQQAIANAESNLGA